MPYGWQTVWSCLMHDLPMFSHITSVTDASFMLLGDLVSNDIVNMVIVPTDIWDLKCFKSVTSMSKRPAEFVFLLRHESCSNHHYTCNLHHGKEWVCEAFARARRASLLSLQRSGD